MKLNVRFNIPEEATVLEIGPGGDPFPRADMFVERYLDESSRGYNERGRVPLRVGKKPLICADAASLPFKAGEFDYIIASHVIEHLAPDSIDPFIEELQRTAKNVYLETPTVFFEIVRDISEHKWFIVFRETAIHLCAKDIVNMNPVLERMRSVFSTPEYFAVLKAYPSLFFQQINWSSDNGQIRIYYHDDIKELLDLYEDTWIIQIINKQQKKPISPDTTLKHRIIHIVKLFIPPFFGRILAFLRNSCD